MERQAGCPLHALRGKQCPETACTKNGALRAHGMAFDRPCLDARQRTTEKRIYRTPALCGAKHAVLNVSGRLSVPLELIAFIARSRASPPAQNYRRANGAGTTDLTGTYFTDQRGEIRLIQVGPLPRQYGKARKGNTRARARRR